MVLEAGTFIFVVVKNSTSISIPNENGVRSSASGPGFIMVLRQTVSFVLLLSLHSIYPSCLPFDFVAVLYWYLDFNFNFAQFDLISGIQKHTIKQAQMMVLTIC